MKRIIVTIVINYILGIIIGLYETISIILLLLSFIIVSVLSIKLTRILIIRNIKRCILMLTCVLIGVFSVKYYETKWITVNENLRDKNVIAKVVNLEKETTYQKTFKVKILNKNRDYGKYILLKINKKENISEKIKIRSNYCI